MWSAASLRRFTRFTHAQRVWFLLGLVSIPVGHVIARLVPYSVWSAWLHPLRSEKPSVKMTPGAIGAEIARAGRAIPRSTCLAQAIAAQLLYRLAGYRTHVVLGVARKNDGAVQAHAWVTDSRGAIVLGWIPELEQYVPFATGQPPRNFA